MESVFLHPQLISEQKETYGFNSTTPTPQIKELANFENKLFNLIRNMKFKQDTTTFQRKLQQDIRNKI